MPRKIVGAAVAASLVVAACGTREPDRAAVAAATGASGSAATSGTNGPSDRDAGSLLRSDPEVRTPLDNDKRDRAARRSRAERDARAQAERTQADRAQAERDARGAGSQPGGSAAEAGGPRESVIRTAPGTPAPER